MTLDLTSRIAEILVLTLAGAMSVVVVLSKGLKGHFFRNALVLFFVVVQLASGVIHLWPKRLGNRGFIDLTDPTLRGAGDYTLQAVAIAVIGLLCLLAGAYTGPLRRREVSAVPLVRLPTTSERQRILLAIGLILPISLTALTILRAHLSSEDSLRRVVNVTGGFARYAFLSHWLVWAIALAACLILFRKRAPGPLLASIVVLVSCALIAAALSWTGGRSIVVLMCLPLVYVTWRQVGRGNRITLLILVGVGLIRLITLTSERLVGYQQTGFNLASVIDWQVGRFSMSGFAVYAQEQHGLYAGETILAGIAAAPIGILHTIGLAGQSIAFPTSSQVAGEILLNDPGQTYIAPGAVAELYLNFGFIGVAVGMYLLGLAARAIDNVLARRNSIVASLAYAYVGSLLIFQTITAESGALPTYILFSGAPIMLLLLIEKVGSSGGERALPQSVNQEGYAK